MFCLYYSINNCVVSLSPSLSPFSTSHPPSFILSPSLSPSSLFLHLPSSLSHPLSLILSLSPQSSESHGTVLLSMCYSPDSKKLSVILLRAKDLNKENDKETGKSGSPAHSSSHMCLEEEGGRKWLGRLSGHS